MPSTYNPAPIPTSAYYDGTLENYKLGDYNHPVIKVYHNGTWVTVPMQKPDASYLITTLVDAGRNTQGQVIGVQIGRTQNKIDGLVFPFLYAHEWSKLCGIFRLNLEAIVRFHDAESNTIITRVLYVGDRSAQQHAIHEELLFGEDVHRWEVYRDCAFNLIDMGK